MEKDYQTKDLKAAKSKPTPKKDGDIFKDKGGMWKFKWKGSECGYLTKAAAEEGLKKVSGKAED